MRNNNNNNDNKSNYYVCTLYNNNKSEDYWIAIFWPNQNLFLSHLTKQFSFLLQLSIALLLHKKCCVGDGIQQRQQLKQQQRLQQEQQHTATIRESARTSVARKKKASEWVMRGDNRLDIQFVSMCVVCVCVAVCAIRVRTVWWWFLLYFYKRDAHTCTQYAHTYVYVHRMDRKEGNGRFFSKFFPLCIHTHAWRTHVYVWCVT